MAANAAERTMLNGSVESTLLIVRVIVVFGPIVAERFRFPGIAGILLLMFLAGLKFNFKAFKENRRAAMVYGLLGFAIPFGLSMWIEMSALGYGVLAAALVGAMWASNTLVAYPEVSVTGLQTDLVIAQALAGCRFRRGSRVGGSNRWCRSACDGVVEPERLTHVGVTSPGQDGGSTTGSRNTTGISLSVRDSYTAYPS
ncbi:MAG TPA: cation:proton antiporter [Acidimicrobiia bacterium]|nr:cation:proton antiporter [Acidimicrobiia bacterium]